MRWLISLVVAVLTASSAAAVDVPLRSGEHGSFTRLVARVPAGTEWKLQTQDGGARLLVDLPEAIFLTDDVFRRITHARLKSLHQSGPGAPLELEFSCDCAARGFVHDNTMIVLDIADSAQAVDRPVLPQPRPVFSATTGADRVPPADANILPRQQSLRSATKGTASDPDGTATIEDRLLTQILRGADQEVVSLNLAPIGPRRSATTERARALTGFEANHQIAVATVVDRALDARGVNTPLQVDAAACLTDHEIGFDNWSDKTTFSAQLAAARSALFGEFDRIDPAQVLRLAKLQTYYGFGAEASQTLALADSIGAEGAAVRAIAVILDDLDPPPNNVFRNQQRCDGDAALWSLLSEGQVAENADTDAIELAFARLPDHLKTRLGPRLSELMTRAGKLEAARRFLRAAERGGATQDGAAMLASAELAGVERDTEKQVRKLSEVIEAEEAAAEAPLALARLIEQRWAENGAVTNREVELIAAFNLQYRRSDLGPQLALAHGLALALNGEYDEALGQLMLLDRQGIGTGWERTFDRVLALVTERADHVTFLRHAGKIAPDLKSRLSTETGLAVIDRLDRLGFAGLTQDYAHYMKTRELGAPQNVILARAALGAGLPHRALLLIQGDEGDAASQLRAEAMLEIGDYSAATDHFRRAEDLPSAARSLWLARSWTQAAEMATGEYSAMSGLSQQLTADPDAELTTPLADARRLLDSSDRTRKLIAELLQAVE